ncbi:P4a precursor [Mythimna separata entomopoxvirus 'L']|uniref:P4a n=1 Tax=Mythimna separata entomopoxvirus 'L' TaxID=1293572 RepID=A0A916NYL0_9POXV|nr:P4a precursor [Mythimna separata entomopoxvirus 'L']CCU56379.1 P4a precursor [Mythimna separata entomopoxvirus 'L']
MRNKKEIYMNHFTDFIIQNLPFRNLIKEMNEIKIKDETYKLDDIFNSIYYHPLDILSIDLKNADKKNEYTKQFTNNLYMRYGYNEMDFIHNNIKYDEKVFSNITELNYFPIFTSEFIKYRLSHYESYSNIRGGRISLLSGKSNTGFGYILSENELGSKYIWEIVNYYLKINDEDEYDFYTQYIPFIRYFTNIYYNSIYPPNNPQYNALQDNPNPESDNIPNITSQENFDNFINKIGYYSTSNERYKQINNTQDFYEHLNINTIKNPIKNYKNIIKNIYETIMLYNVSVLKLNDSLDIIASSDLDTIINFYKNYVEDSSRLYRLVSIFKILNKRNSNLSQNDKLKILAGGSLVLLLKLGDEREDMQYYKNNVIKYFEDGDINNINNIINKLNTKISDLNFQSPETITDNTLRELINGTYNSENYNVFIKTSENIENAFDVIIPPSLPQNNNYAKKIRLVLVKNFLQSIFNNANDNQLIDNLFIQVKTNFISYVDLKTNSTQNIMKPIDIRKEIKDRLENFNKEYKIYDPDIKMNYKVFISLLPTIYYIIFSNNKRNTNNVVYVNNIIKEQEIVDRQPPEELIENRRVPRVRFNFDPYTSNSKVTTDNEALKKSIYESNITDLLFWEGISIEDFNKFPLYIKTILMDSCLLLGLQDTNNDDKTCVIYDNNEFNIDSISRICIIPYPYTASKTMYDIFKKVSDRIGSEYKRDYNILDTKYNNNIGLKTIGNNKFINMLADCDDVKDLINNYVILRETYEGSDKLELPSANQELYFCITLLNLLGFSIRLYRRSGNNNISYYIQLDKPLTSSNIISMISKEYKNINRDKQSADIIINILSPIIGYLRSILLKYRTTPLNYAAGSDDAGYQQCCIPIQINPLDQLNNMDMTFTESDNIFDIMNKDIFNLDNDIFKHIVTNSVYYGGENMDIVDTIYDNIPQSIYMKTDIIDKIYGKMFAGAYSINEILDITYEDDNNEEDIDANLTRELIKKLKKLLNKSNNANIEDNANIVKSQILSSINNVFNRYSCSDRIPIQYLINIRALLKQYSNENIDVTPEVKERIRTTINSIYKNTKNIIKIITTLSAGIDLVKAYKRSNIDVSDTIIDDNFIKKLCELCKESFYKYNRNNDTVYKNLLKDVFDNVEIQDYDIDDEIC